MFVVIMVYIVRLYGFVMKFINFFNFYKIVFLLYNVRGGSLVSGRYKKLKNFVISFCGCN